MLTSPTPSAPKPIMPSQGQQWLQLLDAVSMGSEIPAARAAMPTAAQDDAPTLPRVAQSWRVPQRGAAVPNRVEIDHPASGYVYGLHALPAGGFVAVANRPGRWRLRCDGSRAVIERLAPGSAC